MKRFQITISKSQVWYYYSLYDRHNQRTFTDAHPYNSEVGALDAATRRADQYLSEEPDPNVYEYGPEI